MVQTFTLPASLLKGSLVTRPPAHGAVRRHPHPSPLPPAGEGNILENSTMSLSEIKAALPDYARDLRLNLDSVLAESGAPGLNSKQIGLVALASAIAAR